MKKGFTLVELLAVIVILGVILAIAIPKIFNIVENARESAYQSNEKMLVNAARNYIAVNSSSTPIYVGETTIVQLSSLQSNQLIGTINDLKDKTVECEGYVLIRKINESLLDYTPYLKCEDNYISSTIIKDNLVLDMPLGDYMSGNTYLDRSGFDNHGTNYGSILIANRFNISSKASSFNGVNNYIDLGNPAVLHNMGSEVTASAWVKYNEFGGGGMTYSVVLVKGSPWTFLMENPAQRIRFRVHAGGVDDSVSDTVSHELNRWYNFVGTYDGNHIKIYKDGIMVGIKARTGALGISTATAKIGTFQPTSYNLNGSIDDVRIYNRALTADEIKHNYDIEKTISR